MKNMTFEVIENGKKVKFDIIDYCKYKDNNYVIYTEENKDDIYASRYEIVNNQLVLNEIQTDEEWDYIDKVLEGLDNGEA